MRLLGVPKSSILASNKEALNSMRANMQNANEPKLLRINLQDDLNIDETLITFKAGNNSSYNVSVDANYMGGSAVTLF